MPLLTPAQLVLVVDERRVRQLISDSNVPEQGPIDGNEVLLELINQASAEVLAACVEGKRYSEDQLQALVDSGNTGGALVRRLVADITHALLVARRGSSASSVDQQVPRYAKCQQMLEQLKEGVRIFPGIPEAAEAGLPTTINTLTNTNRPRLFTDAPANRLFPFDPDRGQGGYPGC